MTRPLALLFACLLLVGFAGCGDDEEEAPSAAATEEPTATPTPEDTGGEQGTGCKTVENRRPRTSR
jgi:hypothetical protein